MNGRIINAVAPTRVCDLGGWTDTWFAGHGAVFSIAIYPYVEVQIRTSSPVGAGPRVQLFVENYGETYALDPENITYDKHPLIEAAIDLMKVPTTCSLAINIYSEAPPGASMGTSAAVSVALVGALARLSGQHRTPHEIAQLAHSIETEKLGMQCGIQDQLASAYGGINFIQMPAFPHASVSAIQIPNNTWWELEHRLAVVYIGSPHRSSETHQKVIADLGPDACHDPRLERLRELATAGKDALYAGDFAALGAYMTANTEVQRKLHPALVCRAFENIIDIASGFGVLGCKVNGAGGDGGSLTILTDGDAAQKRRLLQTLTEKGFKPIPLYLSRQGLRVWETP
ncbi:MAG: GHMP kinase [Verrucomicrobia bacterium]|nr:GHMP kinase [Verrucomicrobiota bacterium]